MTAKKSTPKVTKKASKPFGFIVKGNNEYKELYIWDEGDWIHVSDLPPSDALSDDGMDVGHMAIEKSCISEVISLLKQMEGS